MVITKGLAGTCGCLNWVVKGLLSYGVEAHLRQYRPVAEEAIVLEQDSRSLCNTAGGCGKGTAPWRTAEQSEGSASRRRRRRREAALRFPGHGPFQMECLSGHASASGARAPSYDVIPGKGVRGQSLRGRRHGHTQGVEPEGGGPATSRPKHPGRRVAPGR